MRSDLIKKTVLVGNSQYGEQKSCINSSEASISLRPSSKILCTPCTDVYKVDTYRQFIKRQVASIKSVPLDIWWMIFENHLLTLSDFLSISLTCRALKELCIYIREQNKIQEFTVEGVTNLPIIKSSKVSLEAEPRFFNIESSNNIMFKNPYIDNLKINSSEIVCEKPHNEQCLYSTTTSPRGYNGLTIDDLVVLINYIRQVATKITQLNIDATLYKHVDTDLIISNLHNIIKLYIYNIPKDCSLIIEKMPRLRFINIEKLYGKIEIRENVPNLEKIEYKAKTLDFRLVFLNLKDYKKEPEIIVEELDPMYITDDEERSDSEYSDYDEGGSGFEMRELELKIDENGDYYY